MVGRKGKKKAATAIAHKILVIAYHILATGEPYNELGADFLEKRRSISTEELMIRDLGTHNPKCIAYFKLFSY